MTATSPDNILADAVVALLTALPALAGQVIQRRHVPLYDPAKLLRVHIAVAPRTHARRIATRASTERTYTVQIAPHVRLQSDTEGAPDPDQLSDFVDMLDNISDALETAALDRTHYAGFTLTNLESDPLIDADLIQSPGVIRGIITATFKAVTQPAA